MSDYGGKQRGNGRPAPGRTWGPGGPGGPLGHHHGVCDPPPLGYAPYAPYIYGADELAYQRHPPSLNRCERPSTMCVPVGVYLLPICVCLCVLKLHGNCMYHWNGDVSPWPRLPEDMLALAKSTDFDWDFGGTYRHSLGSTHMGALGSATPTWASTSPNPSLQRSPH